jgi:hypothetical protein
MERRNGGPAHLATLGCALPQLRIETPSNLG